MKDRIRMKREKEEGMKEDGRGQREKKIVVKTIITIAEIKTCRVREMKVGYLGDGESMEKKEGKRGRGKIYVQKERERDRRN